MTIAQVKVFIDGMTFVVTGEYDPPSAGRYSGPMEDCYESEPSEFDLISIEGFACNGERIIPCTDGDDERIECMDPDFLKIYENDAYNRAVAYLDGE